MVAMRLPGQIGISRVAPIAVLFILCLVAFLYPYQSTHLTTGMVATTVSMVEHASHDVGKPGGGHHVTGNYSGAALEESEAGNQLPVNAEYLGALLLVVFLGVLLSVLGSRRSWSRRRVLKSIRDSMSPATAPRPRELSPSFISVFIL